MLTSAKAVWLIVGLYLFTIVLPAGLNAALANPIELHNAFPPEVLRHALMACALFVLGLAFGAQLFPFSGSTAVDVSAPGFRKGFVGLVVIVTMIVVYVIVAGPPAPFFASFSLTDPNAITQAREDALKLNPDVVFVRLYSWGRDLFAPATLALAILTLRHGRGRFLKAVAAVGIVGAVFLALWSGQKATIVIYLLAAFVFLARDSRSMVTMAAVSAPLFLAISALLFRLTLPNLAGNPDALRLLSISIANRLVFAPLEVVMSYVDALERMHTIGRLDALPYLSFLWTPGILSVENHIGISYFTSDQESSIYANGAAFAYAYVLGGYIGAFLGGALVIAALKLGMRIVRATGSVFLQSAYAATVCYTIIDLQTSNFLPYLVKIVVLALLIWGTNELWPKRSAAVQPAAAPT